MICKECGAYNPDHATYCKVCAANLKEDVQDVDSVDAVDDSRPTRSFVRPSWTIPAYAANTAKRTAEQAETEIKEDAVEDFEEEELPAAKVPVGSVPKTKAKVAIPQEIADELNDLPEEDADAFEPIPEEAEKLQKPVSKTEPSKKPKARPIPVEEETVEDAEDTDEEEEEYVPVYHRQRTSRIPARRLAEEEDAEDEDEYESNVEDSEDEDDSYEYEPTPPKRKKNNKGNGPLFWILLVAIIVVILCIIAAGVLMLMQSNGNSLSCTGTEQAVKTQQNTTPATNSDSQQNVDSSPAPAETDQNNPYAVVSEDTLNEKGEECVTFHIIAPAHSVVTLVLPSQPEYKFTNEKDLTVEMRLPVPKTLFYPNEILTSSEYEVHPELYLTESNGVTTTLEVQPFTLTFPTLTIDVEKPVADAEGKIMADKSNIVAISGNVDDYDVTVYINGERVTVYDGGLFMYDYAVTSDSSETVTIHAEKSNYVSATTELTVDPYVFVPEKMILEVTNDKVTGLKADNSGKVTVRGLTLPEATLVASSDSAKVVCGSPTVDSEGNFLFTVTMDSSFYGIAHVTIDAEKAEAESGSTTVMVYRSYSDKNAFIKGYSATKKYKEIGTGSKYLTIAELMSQQSTYATNDYGVRITAQVVEVVLGEDGYSYVRMTLSGSGETVYVINLSDKWTPESNIGTKYNLYGNFLGTYGENSNPLFCAFFGVKK